MEAWTSVSHSCRLILSELHITASDSSAEFVHSQVMFSSGQFLYSARGKTNPATCLQKASEYDNPQYELRRNELP